MALDETETMPERTINKVKWDDIGVVCGVTASAAAGLPAEKETPPFRRKKRPEPLCYFNSKFMNSPLCVLLSVCLTPAIISILIWSNIYNMPERRVTELLAPTR